MRKLLQSVLRVVLGALFLTAGLSKLASPYDFLGGVYAYELCGPTLGEFVATLLPWLETVVGACLIFGALEYGALCLALFMGVLFMLVRAYASARALSVSCHCFSNETSSTGISYVHLVQSAVIIAVAAIALSLSIRSARRTCQSHGG